MFYDVGYVQFKRISRVERQLVTKLRAFIHSMLMRQWEPRVAEKFDRCITVSNIDKNILLKFNPKLLVDVVPNGVDTHFYQPLPEEEGIPSLLFIGKMNYQPCVDAAIYFCEEILPLIRKRIDNVEVWLVGREPDARVLKLNNTYIHVTGLVESVIPYYKRSIVTVVPLRSGGGTRLKILESMALNRPVVSTTIGCEGLDVVDGDHILIADEPNKFAEKVIQLIENKTLREHIKQNARCLIEDRYDWDQLANNLIQVYSSMLN
jgi:glycosyltransferase involved in cell wall biosynthesis